MHTFQESSSRASIFLMSDYAKSPKKPSEESFCKLSSVEQGKQTRKHSSKDEMPQIADQISNILDEAVRMSIELTSDKKEQPFKFTEVSQEERERIKQRLH